MLHIKKAKIGTVYGWYDGEEYWECPKCGNSNPPGAGCEFCDGD